MSKGNLGRAPSSRNVLFLRSSLLGLALGAALGMATAWAGPNTECPAIPDDLVLELGKPLRIGDLFFIIEATAGPDQDPTAGDGDQVLLIDLLARWMDPTTREPRMGSYVPGLDVTYTLLGAAGFERTGSLDFHLTSSGPAYGTSIPVGQGSGGDEFQLNLNLSRGGPDNPKPDHHPECPELPFPLNAGFRLAQLGSGGGGSQATSDNIRLDLLSSLDARPAESYSDVWGYDNGATQLAIIGHSNGTLFIDVTDPFNPVEVGDILGPNSSWRDIKTYLNYAYITTEGSGTGEGMQIVNLADPLNPVLVNTYIATFTTAHNIYIDTAKGHAWILGPSGGTRILDLTQDPENPVEIGTWPDRYVHDAYVADNFAYFSEINNGLQEVLDSTNVANVQLLSSWPTPGGSTHNCWANVDHTVLATTDETGGGHVAVYDITDKNSPAPLLGEYISNSSAIVHNVMFDDDDVERIAMSHYALGAKYVDLHRLSAPVELGSYDTFPGGETGFNGAWGVYAFDPRGYIFISDIQTGLYVLDYVPTGGTLSGVIRDAGNGLEVPGARVVVLADGTEAIAGADGVYAVYAPAGPVQLRASAWGFRTAILDAGTMPLDGRLDVDLDLARLPRTGLSGVVRRSDDSTGIGGATVRIVGGNLEATTAPDGSYDFPEVAIGQQTVTAEAFGFSSGEARAVLADGQAAGVDIFLDPAILVDDAETDLGWGLGVLGDTATQGQWERVDPNGTGGGNVQPEDDHTADPAATAFITGQSAPGAGTEANDVEFGFTTLLSPSLDASGAGAVIVRYHRWLSTTSGFLNGGTLRVQASPDGGLTWNNLEVTSSNANRWTQRQFDLGSILPLTNQMRVRFRAEAASGFENFRTLEVGVDDFELLSGCRSRFNPTNGDSDADGVTDGCDSCPLDAADDFDGDGVCGNTDNAPFVGNPGQADLDGDGVGDAADNCVNDLNAAQRDLDGDGLGDACDADLDGDGLANGADDDQDDDGVPDTSDLCPTVPDALQADADLDGEGDACDRDDGIVQGVRVDPDRITWEPEIGSDDYNVYRGDTGAEALLRLAACRVAGVQSTFYVDGDLPVPGDGFFYLVSRVVGGVEDSLGFKSGGVERLINSPCP